MRTDLPVGTRVRLTVDTPRLGAGMTSDKSYGVGHTGTVRRAADGVGDYQVVWDGEPLESWSWCGAEWLELETEARGTISLEAAARAGADRVLDAVILWYLADYGFTPSELTPAHWSDIERRLRMFNDPARGTVGTTLREARQNLGLT